MEIVSISVIQYGYCLTINREIFVLKIFLASAKIKRTKIMHTINDNVVRGRLSENYLTRKFIAQIFVTRNIHDLRYSRNVHKKVSLAKATRYTCTFSHVTINPSHFRAN